ncbi:reverse transcriptase/maturase family protein [Agathobaculum massiliense]|uniref:reverse transcriptase/maturase family protein n=1 Tax=Agathobaculum massiliense TaxID=3014267 RepID=UPI000D1F9683|nr:reverse transcriptase/maturase family protein [Agathobaculum massiliense]
MRNPVNVLNSLSMHSKESSYQYERIYRLLYNPEMYYTAYQKIYAKPGNMTKGSDNRTIDGISLMRIDKLIANLKSESYQPAPSRRKYIPKKKGKKRPLGIPSFDDKLLQEVVRMILESIYEGHFEETSHGFRPNRSCRTALACIQKYYTGCKWFVEGDIEAFFDTIDHDTLIEILAERIKDARFLRLIRKFLNAGYMEEWQFHKTYSGTPQGGIISPILANIYLNKLDKYMKEYAEKFNTGVRRAHNPKYTAIQVELRKWEYRLKRAATVEERQEILTHIKEIERQRCTIHSKVDMDTNFKRLRYERYADDFLIGVIGSKEDCRKIKQDLKNFLSEKLRLNLSDEKTLITHAASPAHFLGYEISVRYSQLPMPGRKNAPTRYNNGKIVLKIPAGKIRDKLLEYNALKIVVHNGKEMWKPQARVYLRNNDDLEILSHYNAEIRGFYNYYALALNSGTINNLKYVMQYSMLKTFATKYRTSKSVIIKRMRIGKDLGVKYVDSKGRERTALFYNEGFKRKKDITANCDIIPKTIVYSGRSSLTERIKAGKCEFCGKENVPLQMHHVRKLKNLKGKEPWEQFMISRKRKTLAVCEDCHHKIHGDKMD